MTDRLAQLEALYAALAANIAESGNDNVTWRKVLEAFRAVGKPPAESVTERLKSEQP